MVKTNGPTDCAINCNGVCDIVIYFNPICWEQNTRTVNCSYNNTSQYYYTIVLCSVPYTLQYSVYLFSMYIKAKVDYPNLIEPLIVSKVIRLGMNTRKPLLHEHSLLDVNWTRAERWIWSYTQRHKIIFPIFSSNTEAAAVVVKVTFIYCRYICMYHI